MCVEETGKRRNGKILVQVWEKVKTGNLISSLIIYGTYTQHIKIIIKYITLACWSLFQYFLNNVQITTAVLMKKWALESLWTQIVCVKVFSYFLYKKCTQKIWVFLWMCGMSDVLKRYSETYLTLNWRWPLHYITLYKVCFALMISDSDNKVHYK